MCLSPLLRKNPNYGLENVGVNRLKDTTHAYIKINCGVCPQCVALRQSSIVQRCEMMTFRYHAFFMTFTYNNESIPFVDLDGLDCRLFYADLHDVQNTMKRLRKRDSFSRQFKYLVCSEFGHKRHRPHFHALFFIEKRPKDDYNTLLCLRQTLFDSFLHEWSRNVGSRSKPVYKPLLTYVFRYTRNGPRRNYDVQICHPDIGVDNVGFYVTKYIMKHDEWVEKLRSWLYFNLDPEYFDDIWSLVKPRSFWSKNFGDPKNDQVLSWIHNGLEASLRHGDDIPQYFGIYDGKSQPLARYFRNHPDLYSLGYGLRFLENHIEKSDLPISDGSYISDQDTCHAEVKWRKFEDSLFTVNSREDFADDLDF